MKKALIAAAISASLFAGASQAAGNAEAGEKKAQTCMGCHAVKGYYNVYPTYRVPRIWGQHEAYLVAALKGYKNGDRSHETMTSQAASLSDQDMADIAAYFAQNKEQ